MRVLVAAADRRELEVLDGLARVLWGDNAHCVYLRPTEATPAPADIVAVGDDVQADVILVGGGDASWLSQVVDLSRDEHIPVLVAG